MLLSKSSDFPPDKQIGAAQMSLKESSLEGAASKREDTGDCWYVA